MGEHDFFSDLIDLMIDALNLRGYGMWLIQCHVLFTLLHRMVSKNGMEI